MLNEPLSPIDAQKLMRAMVATGDVLFTRHARDEMSKDGLSIADVDHVLHAGIVEPGEYEHGSWRYRVHTQRVWVVVAFRSETSLVVVTVWKVGR